MERRKASDFPQELHDLAHEYLHCEIDRRTFLDRSSKFAVGGLTVAAIFEAFAPNYALAQQVAKDDKRIRTEVDTVPSPQGNGTIKGYLVRPATGTKFPSIIVIHENRGLNPYIEDVARRLGTEGYMAFAPDGLTSVGGYPGDDEKGGTLFAQVDRAKMTEDFVAAANWLKARPDSTGRLGAIGFCYGGGIANTLATRLPDLRAAVPFYGAVPPPAEIAKIKAAILVHHGETDTRLAGSWPDYDKALTAAGVPHEGYIYAGAGHGFHNDSAPTRYNEEAAKLAWSRTRAWFNKYVKG
jgi:carboxymethylenebutenolidase